MTAYAIAWLVAAAAALSIAGLLFVALRRLRHWRYLIVGLTLALALTPYRFDEAHTAPAFMVAAFRLLFEDDALARPPLVLVLLVSAGVALAYFLGWGTWMLWRAARRQLRQ